jgi:hypothetical protein
MSEMLFELSFDCYAFIDRNEIPVCLSDVRKYWTTNSMKQSPWEADSRSAGQEINPPL